MKRIPAYWRPAVDATLIMLVIGSIFGPILVGSGEAQNIPTQIASTLDDLYKEAKKEGTIVFFAPTDANLVRDMHDRFKKRFPGIELQHFQIISEEIVPRMITESQAGICSLDVGSGSDIQIQQLIERNLLADYQWSQVFNIPSSYMIWNSRGILQRTQLYSIAYNTNLVKNTKVFPKSTKAFLETLLNAQWKGKMLLDRRGWMFSHLAATALNDEWMTDYLKKLRMQKPVFCKGINALSAMISAGEADIGMPVYTYMLNDLNAKKAPIDWFRLSPMVYTTRNLYVPKGAPHPNAARLWAGWTCSSEGIKAWEEVSGEGIALPGSGTKIRRLLDQEGIEIVTLKTPKDLIRSEELETKYANILAGR